MADVHLISMRAEMNGIVVPGKLYGAMAAGRPVVFVGPDHCESADTIKSAGCGMTFPTGDATRPAGGTRAARLRSEPRPAAWASAPARRSSPTTSENSAVRSGAS